MPQDPLDTLSQMAEQPPSQETAWGAVSAGLSQAWARIDTAGRVGGIEGDDRITFLYLVGNTGTHALIFRIANGGIEVSYGAAIEVPPRSGRYVPQSAGTVQNHWRWDETTEANVIDAVNFWAHLEHVIE